MNSASKSHYVYIYRDLDRNPMYVGYGSRATRAVSHQSGSHNPRLDAFLRKARYTLEICGPFRNEATGRALETALISALDPKLNIHPGEGRWQFRPLGVPEHLADRLAQPPLTRRDLLRRCRLASRTPFVFVTVTSDDAEDGRKGYDLTRPPKDKDILVRMDRWWTIGKFVPRWSRSPAHSPAVLVGIHGRPGAQVIIGAVRINWRGWTDPERDGGYYAFPTDGPANLDAFGLRGRRIDRKAGIKFGSFNSQFVVRMAKGGGLSGGYPR